MYYLVERRSESEWTLVEDQSVIEFSEEARRSLLRRINFHRLASGKPGDMLLVCAGMGMGSGAFGTTVQVLSCEGFADLLYAKERQVEADGKEYPLQEVAENGRAATDPPGEAG